MVHIRIVTILVSVVFGAVILAMIKNNKLKTSYALLWLAVFLGLVVVTIVPGFLEFLSQATGLYYITALLFVSMLFMVVLCLHFSSVLSQLVYQNRLMAERIAFLEKKTTDLLK